MRKWKLFSVFMFAMLSMITTNLVAQGVPISGTVVSEAGAPVSGATVSVRGTTRSTVTNEAGKFTINADANATLEISHVSFTTQSVKASAGMVVRLVAGDATQLGDVVVTAMGIKKERKALGYSVTEINAQELMRNKNTNVVNSLAGKVPGVNITQFSGSAGAGASITIRGGTSTSEGRQNQPLFIVDGVIYDNSTSVTGNSGTDGQTRSNTTFSNRVMDINPEDIESLSVLKGAAASALYGSRAADGVVIITTKKGADGAAKVTSSNKVSASWANKLPEVQTQFGNGSYSSNGILNNTSSYNSWGNKLTAADKVYDNIGSFFKTGMIYDNNVNVSGGSKNGSFFVSGSNFKQTGIVPNTSYDKTTFRFNGEQKYGALTINANVAYSVANINRTLTTAGLYGSGVGSMQSLYLFPQVFDISDYQNADGTQKRIYAAAIPNIENDIDNPYWIINKDKLTSQTKRLTGVLAGNYKVASWWDITARLGYDQYFTNDYTYIAPGSAVAPLYQNGRLSKNQVNYTFINTTVMSNFHKTFGDFEAHIMLGTTTENALTLRQTQWGYNFITAGTISFANMANTNKFFTENTSRKRLVGVFSEAGVSYKNIAYLTLTGRNDWSSTLPQENWSYFYPSLSGSFVFTELLPRNRVLSFGKIRASVARVGKDTDPYVTNTYVNPPISIGSYTGIGNQYYAGNGTLIPEIQNSWEIGAELRFLNGRLGLDYTYYHSETMNQIAQPRLAQSGGFIFSALNSGSVYNSGMEVAITGKPVVSRNFSWEATINFSYNKGRLGSFLPGIAYFYPTDAQFGTVKAASIPNGYFLGMTGQPYLRELDSKGVEVADGRYQVDPATGLYKVNANNPVVGNREPDFIGGFNNTFHYKKLTLSFLLDIRKGGAVFNGTEYAMVVNGLAKRTTANDRQSVTVTGVNSVTGADYTATYNAGQTYTIGTQTLSGNYLIQQYWANYAANSYNFLTNVNWLKLRSLSLSYDFTDHLKSKKIFKGISVTAVGTNLWTLTNYKGMDPEVSAAGGTGGSGSQGIDYLGVPATASFTFGVNITL
ncbi:SusC/RagA family TonB-linked outer membrane protein [Sediminibacterium roseum]|uniref:SusC/RagA family TonB-linked outer membrane protein n=1 Tax=Sediminibacterium roseum TaxID=1978412 RepID=A0ABW9ZVC7_9BACT|nr:SusC/RagA family TonB-linked outer membrane protein [Sediminibacterium roseum]NCI50964.1 SusC/RagA family TonB-linked outer membrane protein [Sediminibacterium roseum]